MSHLMHSHAFFVVDTKEDYMMHVLPMEIMVFHGAVHLLMTKEYILIIQSNLNVPTTRATSIIVRSVLVG